VEPLEQFVQGRTGRSPRDWTCIKLFHLCLYILALDDLVWWFLFATNWGQASFNPPFEVYCSYSCCDDINCLVAKARCANQIMVLRLLRSSV